MNAHRRSLGLALVALFALGGSALTGCATDLEEDAIDDSEEALTGAVTPGTCVKANPSQALNEALGAVVNVRSAAAGTDIGDLIREPTGKNPRAYAIVLARKTLVNKGANSGDWYQVKYQTEAQTLGEGWVKGSVTFPGNPTKPTHLLVKIPGGNVPLPCKNLLAGKVTPASGPSPAPAETAIATSALKKNQCLRVIDSLAQGLVAREFPPKIVPGNPEEADETQPAPREAAPIDSPANACGAQGQKCGGIGPLGFARIIDGTDADTKVDVVGPIKFADGKTRTYYHVTFIDQTNGKKTTGWVSGGGNFVAAPDAKECANRGL